MSAQPLPLTEPGFCGCEEPAGRLIPVDVALRRGLALAEPVAQTETLPLAAVAGRALAQDACAPLPLPPFDNSAMDGYAVRLADLGGEGPWRLPVSGRVAAGQTPPASWPAGTALRILTGAPVAGDADAVVMQEHVAREDGAVVVSARPRAGLNIRRMGEDLAAGGRILPAGAEIGAREAAALAATGAPDCAVRRKLRVALFCTGSELRQPGEALGPGQIWNSNRFMLRAALERPWIELTDLGAVPDDPASLTAALEEAAAGADLVVSTGGVSVGDEDHMPRLFREAGGDIHAMRIAMKPGKPLALGRMGEAIYLGLPGNPAAAFVTWFVIGAQIARRRAGFARVAPFRIAAKAGSEVTRRAGRCEFRPARITGYDAQGAQVVELMSSSYSARIALLAAADGLALLPAEAERVRAGDLLEFLPFD
ncbi:MAG: gephyrin-like molybdotransferase Glp [Pseudomonadota bacterium]